jgi:hypothetical protein
VPSLRDFAQRSGERNNLVVFIDFYCFLFMRIFCFLVETQCIASLRQAEEGLKARKSLAQGNAL